MLNAAVRWQDDAPVFEPSLDVLLTQRQRVQLARVETLLADDPEALAGRYAPTATDRLWEYEARLLRALASLEAR